ncbi:hypothetical protein Tco_0882520, partial [Tanacetum coccineum]
RLKEKEIPQQESLVTEGTIMEACLVTQGIEMDDNLVALQCTVDSSTSSEQQNKRNSLVEQKDTISLCSASEEQHMQLQARSQK